MKFIRKFFRSQEQGSLLMHSLVVALIGAIILFGTYTLVKYKGILHSASYKVKHLEQSGLIPVLDRSADLAGPDLDNNGIRDDIDAYINKS